MAMLCENYVRDDLDVLLNPSATWSPFPPAADRGAWIDLQRHPLRGRQASWLVGRAEGVMDLPWPALPAELALRFQRDGDRESFQKPYFRRRNRLGRAVLAECLEGHGRFIDEVVNGLVLICSELSWCLPAHYGGEEEGSPARGIPRADLEVVDLFAAETAMVIGETCTLLGAELDAISPEIRAQCRKAVRTRIFEPILAREDWKWSSGRNNWTPWIAANVLGANAYLNDDRQSDLDVTWKMMTILDRFIGKYGADGACDEGPHYYNVAAGSLMMALEVLHDRSEGSIDYFANQKIRTMAHWILDMHLGWQWFASFADNKVPLHLRPSVLWRSGERCADPDLKNLAQLALRGFDPLGPVDPPVVNGYEGGDLVQMARQLWWMDPDAEAFPMVKRLDVFHESTQVMVAHESSADACDLVLAAKGGNNGESHNHNDVGQFILMLDGVPALIDLGSGTYTRETFSDRRYESWIYSAFGHAVPQINGYLQENGAEFGAADVAHHATRQDSVLEMDLTKCYPAEADIHRAHRQIGLHRIAEGGEVLLTDDFAIEDDLLVVELPLLTNRGVTVIRPGLVEVDCGESILQTHYDADILRVTLEKVHLEDPQLRSAWGPELTRIRFRAEVNERKLGYTLRFSSKV